MTPEQRYLFDTVGYFSLKNALSSEELQRAQEAADRYINTPPDDLPVGFHFRNLAHDKHYLRGFAFDRALEHLTMHPFFSSKKPAEAGGEVALSRYQAFIVA